MIPKSVRVTFESKIPGGAQYSSLLLGFTIEADMEEGDELTVILDQLARLLREKAKEHLRPMRADQRDQLRALVPGTQPAALAAPAADALVESPVGVSRQKGAVSKRKPDADDLDFDSGLPIDGGPA